MLASQAPSDTKDVDVDDTGKGKERKGDEQRPPRPIRSNEGVVLTLRNLLLEVDERWEAEAVRTHGGLVASDSRAPTAGPLDAFARAYLAETLGTQGGTVVLLTLSAPASPLATVDLPAQITVRHVDLAGGSSSNDSTGPDLSHCPWLPGKAESKEPGGAQKGANEVVWLWGILSRLPNRIVCALLDALAARNSHVLVTDHRTGTAQPFDVAPGGSRAVAWWRYPLAMYRWSVLHRTCAKGAVKGAVKGAAKGTTESAAQGTTDQQLETVRLRGSKMAASGLDRLDKVEKEEQAVAVRYSGCLGTTGWAVCVKHFVYALWLQRGASISFVPLLDSTPEMRQLLALGAESGDVHDLLLLHLLDRPVGNHVLVLHESPLAYAQLLASEEAARAEWAATRRQLRTAPWHLPSALVDAWYPNCLPQAKKSPLGLYGLPVWETTCVPAAFEPGCRLMDVVALPSEFNAAVFKQSLGPFRPRVEHVPAPILAADRGRFLPATQAEARARLGLAAKPFLFYTINEWNHRKSLHELVACFVESFSARDGVELFIKTGGFDVDESEARAWIEACRARRPRLAQATQAAGVARAAGAAVGDAQDEPALIHLDFSRWPQDHIDTLHLAGDVYVSLAKGEGIGLGACQAALFERPIIATGFGAQTEFLEGESVHWVRYQLGPASQCLPGGRKHRQCAPRFCRVFFGQLYDPGTQRWAVPDLDHARELLQRAAAERWRPDRTAADHLRARFAPELTGRAHLASLRRLFASTSSAPRS